MVGAVVHLPSTNAASFTVTGDARVRGRSQGHDITATAIPALTAAELLDGLARKPGTTALAAAVTAFLRQVRTPPWDSDVPTRCGGLRADLEAAGIPLGGMDMLIAAHALTGGAVRVTNDRAFGRVSGLRTDDWTALPHRNLPGR